MNSNTTAVEDNKPDLSSYIAAFISLGLIAGICLTLVLRLEALRKENAITKLEPASVNISQLIEIERPEGLARFWIKNDKDIFLEELNSANSALLRDDYPEIKNIIGKWGLGAEILKKIEILEGQAGSIANRAEEKESLLSSAIALKTEFQLLQSEVCTYFGLPVPDGKNAQITFYEKGVLQGLPKLDAFPDDLPDLQTFSAKLNEAGGKISFEENTDPVAVFQEKLEDLRDRAFKLSLTSNGQDEKIAKLNSEISDLQNKAEADKLAISRFLNKVAFDTFKK
jgi:hypothetical protein